MPEPIQPIAPQMQPMPVAPPMSAEQFQSAPGSVALTETVQPSAPGMAAVANVQLNYPSPSQKYEEAVNSADIRKLSNLAKDGAGTQTQVVADKALKVIEKNAKQFNELTAGINPDNPQDRLKFVDRAKLISDPKLARKYGYSTIADNPQWGPALMLFAAGQKDQAMKFIIGGPMKDTLERLGKTGRQVVVQTNDLGQVGGIFDRESGDMMTVDEYVREGGELEAYKKTLEGMTRFQNQEQYAKKFAESTEANNAYLANQRAITPLLEEKFNIWKQLDAGLTKDQRQTLAGMASGQVSYSRRLSEGQQLLDQFNRNRDIKLSAEERQAMNAALSAEAKARGLSAAPQIGADNTVTDGTNKSWGSNELKNFMGNFNVGKALEQSYTQAQSNLAEQLAIGNLSNDQYKMLQAALDIDKQIETKNAELRSKYGTPLFFRSTVASNIADQSHRAQVQTLQGLFNSEAADAFDRFRKAEVEKAREIDSSYVPAPNELENAFTKSPVYKGLLKKYKDQSRAILETPYREVAVPGATSGIGYVGPEQARLVEKPLPAAQSPSSAGRKELTLEQRRADRLKEANRLAREAAK